MDDGELHYGHPCMPMSERAKIFVPFDPLKGFRDALRERERLAEAPRDFASDVGEESAECPASVPGPAEWAQGQVMTR